MGNLYAATSATTIKTNNYKGQPYIEITKSSNSKYAKTINSILKQFAVNAAIQNSEAKKDNSEYWFKTTTRLMYNKNNVFSVNNETSEYWGGAHDQQWTDTYNFDISSGKRLYLKDVLNSKTKISNAKEYISYVLSEKSKKGVGIFEENITDFPLDPTKSPFYFRDSGITIRFNPYEVGSFAEGIIDVTIPYAIIDGQNSIPSQPPDTNLNPSIADGLGMFNSYIYNGVTIKRGMSKAQVLNVISKPDEVKTPLRGSSEEIEEMKKVFGKQYNFQDIEQWTYVNKESDSPSAFVIFFNHEGYVASLYTI
jgi:hypothetical protein